MGTSVVRLTGVAKRYGRREPYVLLGVDATLTAGDIVHVRGINGSGKSTLLRIVAGVTAPSRGSVGGRPRSVGYVPERFPPTVRFTPRDYLRHLAGIRGTPPSEGLALLARLGGTSYADVPMTHLSKGSCQKVALAQALMGPPGLLVLDEAWTGLDVDAQAVLTDEVHARADTGGIVLLADHVSRSTAVRPTQRWLVDAGRLTHADAVAPVVTVVLVSRLGRPSTVRVQPSACDALLAEALRTGWSVREVRRR